VNTARQTIFGLVLLGALAALVFIQQQRVELAQGDTKLANQRAATAEQESERSQMVTTELHASLTIERAAQQQLQARQQQLHQALRNRQLQIEELTRENEDLRAWFDTELPVVARRLRERPAITGAAAYQDWLSRRDALHAVSNPAADQRPPAD
jgi:LysB family phage lysis regulatory protein